MAEVTCSAEGCERPVWARTLCGTHYSRWRRRGDVTAPLVQRRGVCSMDGCGGKHVAKGLCEKHYSRLKRWGDPALVKRPGGKPGQGVGADNPAWKGDEVGYQAVHVRLRSQRGSASALTCPCGAPAAQWAYDHADPEELRSPEGYPYSVNLDRYAALCVPCHMALDGKQESRVTITS